MSRNRPDRRSIRRRARHVLPALAPAALLAASTPARAQPGESLLSAGVFIGHQFGASGGFEFGVELLGTRLFGGPFHECGSDKRTGAGGLLQIGIVSFHDVRFSLAAHAGQQLAEQEGPAFSAELGLSYRLGTSSGFGIHTGLLAEYSMLNAALRAQWLRNELWTGVGLRYLPTYATIGHCEVGRPLRTEHGRAYLESPRVRVPNDCSDEAAACQHGAGRGFERDMQLEAASVPAFMQLAGELTDLSAPAGLIEAALAAATDELRHAELCAGLATCYLDERVEPSFPIVTARERAKGTSAFVRLAVESWLDGCLMEGIAAACAAEGARSATEPHARHVQAQIASDESRHAELAWAIVKWAIERGGPSVRKAVLALCDADVLSAGADVAPEGLRRFGRIDHAAIDAIAAVQRRAARDRLAAI